MTFFFLLSCSVPSLKWIPRDGISGSKICMFTRRYTLLMFYFLGELILCWFRGRAHENVRLLMRPSARLSVFLTWNSLLVSPSVSQPSVPLGDDSRMDTSEMEQRFGTYLRGFSWLFDICTWVRRRHLKANMLETKAPKPPLPRLLHGQFPLTVSDHCTLPGAQVKNLDASLDSLFRCHIQYSATAWPKALSSLTWTIGIVP